MKNYKKLIFLLSVAIIAVVSISQVEKQDLSPADMNTENETKFVVPKVEKLQIQDIEPLRADRFEIQLISEKSDVGNGGDRLLTIIGSGFNLTSVSPKVVFGKDFIIENTETNNKGAELYVIISKETLEKLISRTDFTEATVIGGSKPAYKGSGKIYITPKDFIDIDSSNIVSLKYRKGFFIREK